MCKNAWVAGASPRTPLGELTALPTSRRSELIGDSCSRCERVDNSTSRRVVSASRVTWILGDGGRGKDGEERRTRGGEGWERGGERKKE